MSLLRERFPICTSFAPAGTAKGCATADNDAHAAHRTTIARLVGAHLIDHLSGELLELIKESTALVLASLYLAKLLLPYACQFGR